MAGLSYGQRRFLFRRRVVRSSDENGLTIRLISRAKIQNAVVPPLSRVLCIRVFTIVLLFLSMRTAVSAGQSLHIEPGITSQEMLVTQVVFEGDLFFSITELELRVRSRPNRKLLGIPGLRWWLWLHNFGAHTLGGKGLGRAFMATGEPPALFDSTTVASDLEQLQIFYLGEGFREVHISATVRREPRSNKVSIQFDIEAGRPTFIRTFAYNGLDALDREQKLRVARGTLLNLQIDDDDPNPLVQQLEGHRYSEPLLSADGRRLLTTLHNEGYAAVTLDSIHAVVYRVSRDSFDVTVDVKLGPRYRFGDVFFHIVGPESEAADRTASDSLLNLTPGITGGRIEVTIQSDRSFEFGLFRRKLNFRPGDWYDQSKLISTKRRFDAIGAIAFTDVRAVPPEFSLPPSDTDSTDLKSAQFVSPRLSHRFNIQSRRRHQIRLQTFVIQRNGSLPGDDELGIGAGVTYSNLNLFGGGENFSLSITGSVASEIALLSDFTSAQVEIRSNLALPYLTWPMGPANSWFDLDDARTHISLSFLAARRDALNLILRGRGLARYRFELNHTQTLSSFFDIMEITISNPDTLDGFQKLFLDDVLEFIDDPVQRAQVVQDYTEPQFNDARRLTLRWANLDPFRRDNGFAYEFTIESGGNLGFLLDRFVFTPDKLEGSLPGLPIFGDAGSSNRLLYRQYFRFVTDIRKYNRINSLSVIAWKIFVGAAHPYGQADVIPLSRRFFSGGATSVRAWQLSELGPGSANLQNERTRRNSNLNTNIFGGEIKLEGSVELRHTVFRKFMAADWIFAMFIDAGNVWLGPRNPGTSAGKFRLNRFYEEIGIGTGVGVRLAWEYLIVRLDFASKLHDPVRKGELWPDGFSNPVAHFGFGHTF